MMNLRPVFAARHDQCIDAVRDFFDRPACLVADKRGFVIIDCHVSGKFNHAAQRGAVEERQTLARIENKRHAGGRELLGVLNHAVVAVRRDDAERDALRLVCAVQMRLHHRARVECGDLVVLEIGGDHRLRGIRVRQHAHVFLRQAEAVEPVDIELRVDGADRRHDARVAAQQVQRITDVAGAAAEFTAHRRHEKADVQDMHLLGQDVFPKAAFEGHDVVVGERTANERGQGERSC